MYSLENRVCWNGNHKTGLEINLSSCPSSPSSSFPPRCSAIRRVLCVLSRYRRWKHGNQTSGFGFCFSLILISCLRGLGLTFTVLHRYTLVCVCVCGFFCVLSASACTDRRSPRGIRCDTWMGLFAVRLANLYVMYCLRFAWLGRVQAYGYIWDLITGIWGCLLSAVRYIPGQGNESR